MKMMRYIMLLVCGGMIACGGTRIALDPESSDFYETAGLIMTKQEKDIFHHLPDKNSRLEFIQDFWQKRDPDLSTEENEYRNEFLGRIEYANQHFNQGTPGWKTDRGRIYIYFGPPDRIERRPMMNNSTIKGFQIWVYYRYNFGVEFIDRRGDGSYTMDPYSGVIGSFFEAMEMAQMALNYRNEDGTTDYIDFKLTYDSDQQEILLSFPLKGLMLAAEGGHLSADFDFNFFVYESKQGASKQDFSETRALSIKEEDLLKQKNITFRFSRKFSPGKYYFDVVVIGKPDIGKTRKIFTVNIK